MNPGHEDRGAQAAGNSGFAADCVDALPLGAFVADAGGRVVLWNAEMERMTGTPASKALGMPVVGALPPGAGDLARAAVDAASAGALGRDHHGQEPVSFRPVSGETMLLDVSSRPVRTAGGAITGALVVVEDVTERTRRNQANLRSARASSLASLGAAIAHEIRNPLNSIALNLQLLREGIDGLSCPDKAELLDEAATVIEEIRRLDRVVGDVLRFARNSAATLARGDPLRAVTRALRLLAGEAARFGVTIERDIRPAGEVMQDEDMLSRAVYNIALNGIQAMQGGGKLTVRTGVRPHSALIEISDTGPGIPPEIREKVFELFYSRRTGGTGLGLPIAQRIIEAHRGQITVEEAFGGGAAFQIHLPLEE